MRDYSASYDTMTKVISAVVCLMLLGIVLMLRVIFVEAIVPVLILAVYAYSPRGYATDSTSLIIKRLIGNIRVPLAGIREARAGTPADFTGCVRLAGSGGFFGYYGLFRTSKLGKASWYLTDRSHTAIVRTEAKTYVLSPDDREGFLAVLGAPQAAGTPYAAASGGSHTGAIFGLGLGGAVVVLITLLLLYSPGIPGYTLADRSLTIHDRFYPVTLKLDTIDTAHLKVVDLPEDREWRPTLRTNGFANPHYQSGWFRVANGMTIRLYRAGGNRLVLIPPKSGGPYVLYQARDPGAFIAELQQAADSGRPG
ncbi:MAG TPA: PH domain-containing protein [Bryobacteraceae bacterium]|nr:PH domain-containing protein [Bryobacteraceae bacterium]